MPKKKAYKIKGKSSTVAEPNVAYEKRKVHIFKSFEEQEQYELTEMAELSSSEILEQLRRFINIAYGMHGYNPDNLPKKHSIKIISK